MKKTITHFYSLYLSPIVGVLSKWLPYRLYLDLKAKIDSSYDISEWSTDFTLKQWLIQMGKLLEKSIDRRTKAVVLIGEIDKAILIKELVRTRNKIYFFDLTQAENFPHKLLGIPKKSVISKLKQISEPPDQVLFVACSYNNRVVSQASFLLTKSKFKNADFIYQIKASESSPVVTKQNQYVSTVFDLSMLRSVYDYSVKNCVLNKYEIQDAFDLMQCLLQVQNVPGSVAEFGSFYGHSGLIMAELMKRYTIKKKIFLCDTFEGFPEEKLGIDKLWNNTHSVDFEMVKKQFTGYKNVQLVKGDFKDTINTLPDKKYSLVHVDCDSYRATKFVAEKMYPKLSKGGVMIFEDYGHPFCLSARIAVDQYFSKQKNFFAFFSGFSGLYIVVKS